jgi:protein-L-isoaspartate(D-aspartate) O-methyltransferase
MRTCKSAARLLAMLLASGPLAGVADELADERRQMMRDIEEHAREASLYLDQTALDPRVLEVMGRVERHAFIPADKRRLAYANRPVPIGYGQTISQPYIVALMTDLLKLAPNDRVFELGTGSGYQAAILGELARSVYSVEIIEALGERARETLQTLGHDNVQVRIADGYYGWEEHAPFDAIVVTAAASHIPPPLIEQLKPGGRMVIPVGSRFMVQQLVLVEKDLQGKITTRQLLPVMFVPLTGQH